MLQQITFTIMPDITMCDNSNCTFKEECYRFKAIPSRYYQAYFLGDVREEDGTCKHKLEIYKK